MTPFCEVRSTYVGGHAEHGNDAERWCVVVALDPEFWLAAFERKIQAQRYARDLNANANRWRDGR